MTLYKDGPFQKLAPSTSVSGVMARPHRDYFGTLSTAQFDRPERIRPIIRDWRNQWADKPRTADYGLQVFQPALACRRSTRQAHWQSVHRHQATLYEQPLGHHLDRADIVRVKQACTAEMAHAIDLAAASGLRLGDLLSLSWSHIGADAIVINTGKSRGKREAVIPLYDDLRACWRASLSARPGC